MFHVKHRNFPAALLFHVKHSLRLCSALPPDTAKTATQRTESRSESPPAATHIPSVPHSADGIHTNDAYLLPPFWYVYVVFSGNMCEGVNDSRIARSFAAGLCVFCRARPVCRAARPLGRGRVKRNGVAAGLCSKRHGVGLSLSKWDGEPVPYGVDSVCAVGAAFLSARAFIGTRSRETRQRFVPTARHTGRALRHWIIFLLCRDSGIIISSAKPTP